MNKASVQTAFIDLESIQDDVVCLTHQRYRGILEVGSLSFGLQGEGDQEATLASYRAFLNSLAFDLQIVVWPKPVDVRARIAKLDRRALSLPPALAEIAHDEAAYFQRLAHWKSK